jgi:hypothetical protein
MEMERDYDFSVIFCWPNFQPLVLFWILLRLIGKYKC